ncbi:MAG TPA: hypothetical protein VIV61_08420 [Candidatus Ozemobacteraceae bacterium]
MRQTSESPPAPVFETGATPCGPYQPPELGQPEAAPSGEHTGLAAVLAGCAGILLAMSLPALLGWGYMYEDLRAFYHPLRAWYSSCLGHGHRFDWMLTIFGGFYASGEGQLGAYHPFHQMIYRFLPLEAAFAVELLASYPFMLAGMYLFLRGFQLRRDASLFGAMVFTFSSFNTLHLVHPSGTAVVAHIPWLLAAIRAMTTTAPRQQITGEAGIALLTASQLLLGHPQYVWYSLLAETAWSLYLFRGRPDLLLRLAGLKLVGLGIGALQLLPTHEVLRDSDRSTPDLGYLMAFSLNPVNLIQPLTPYLFAERGLGGVTHEFALYPGAAPFILGCWLLMSRRDDERLKGLIRFLTGFLAISLLLAMGRFGGIAVLLTWLPLVGSFRVPSRAMVLVQLAWGVLAGVAWSELAGSGKAGDTERMERLTARLVKLSLLISCLFPLLLSGTDGNGLLAPLALIVAGPALVTGAAYLCRRLAGKSAWAFPLLALFTAVDLGIYGVSYAVFPTEDPLAARARAEAPPGSPGDRLVVTPKTFRPSHEYPLNNHFATQGFIQLDGFAGLEPRSRLFNGSATVQALRTAGVRWVSVLASPTQPERLRPVSPFWLEVPDPLPRLRLVSDTLIASHADEAIPRIDPGTTAIVEHPVDLDPGPPGTARILAESPGFLMITTSTTGRRLTVLADRFHRGWKATLDGQDIELLRVNGDFTGWVAPAGTHTVTLEFRPDSLAWGRLISRISLLLLGLYLLRRSSALKREATASSPA